MRKLKIKYKREHKKVNPQLYSQYPKREISSLEHIKVNVTHWFLFLEYFLVHFSDYLALWISNRKQNQNLDQKPGLVLLGSHKLSPTHAALTQFSINFSPHYTFLSISFYSLPENSPSKHLLNNPHLPLPWLLRSQTKIKRILSQPDRLGNGERPYSSAF